MRKYPHNYSTQCFSVQCTVLAAHHQLGHNSQYFSIKMLQNICQQSHLHVHLSISITVRKIKSNDCCEQNNLLSAKISSHPIPSPHHHRQLFIYCLLRFPNVPDFLYVNIKCPLKLSLPNASIHNITLVAASESQSVQGPGHLHRSLSPPGLGTSRAGTKYDDIS